MEIKKLSAIPYGNAFVEIADKNHFYLWSYHTLVCKVENSWLTVKGLYSATTRRHIGAFMREYCKSNYQVAKQIYTDGYRLNIDTGEIERVE